MVLSKFDIALRLNEQNQLNANIAALHAFYYHGVLLLTTCTVYFNRAVYFLGGGQVPYKEVDAVVAFFSLLNCYISLAGHNNSVFDRLSMLT